MLELTIRDYIESTAYKHRLDRYLRDGYLQGLLQLSDAIYHSNRLDMQSPELTIVFDILCGRETVYDDTAAYYETLGLSNVYNHYRDYFCFKPTIDNIIIMHDEFVKLSNPMSGGVYRVTREVISQRDGNTLYYTAPEDIGSQFLN